MLAVTCRIYWLFILIYTYYLSSVVLYKSKSICQHSCEKCPKLNSSEWRLFVTEQFLFWLTQLLVNTDDFSSASGSLDSCRIVLRILWIENNKDVHERSSRDGLTKACFCLLSCVLHTSFWCAYDVCLCDLSEINKWKYVRNNMFTVHLLTSETFSRSCGKWWKLVIPSALLFSLVCHVILIFLFYHSSMISPFFAELSNRCNIAAIDQNVFAFEGWHYGIEFCSTFTRRYRTVIVCYLLVYCRMNAIGRHVLIGSTDCPAETTPTYCQTSNS